MRHVRGRLVGALVGSLAGVALLVPSAATAQYTVDPGPVPPEVLDKFAACPELPEDVTGLYCINLNAHHGELKLGKTVAQVEDPIEVQVAVGLGPGLSAVIVPAEGGGPGGGASSAINVPGGITGIPELDPVLALDPLGVLTVSASPQLGSPSVGRPGQSELSAAIAFLAFATGAISDDPEAQALGAIPVETLDTLEPPGLGLGLPLSIKLNNLLFGENCQIGTPEEPFTINLTTATTMPPDGVEPLTGEYGEGFATLYEGRSVINPLVLEPPAYGGTTGTRFVDNTFAVPGAKGCDLLPGEVKQGVDELEGLLGVDTGLGSGQGLFDPVINEQVGLPSGAGGNHAKFSIDIESLTYPARHPEE